MPVIFLLKLFKWNQAFKFYNCIQIIFFYILQQLLFYCFRFCSTGAVPNDGQDTLSSTVNKLPEGSESIDEAFFLYETADHQNTELTVGMIIVPGRIFFQFNAQMLNNDLFCRTAQIFQLLLHRGPFNQKPGAALK